MIKLEVIGPKMWVEQYSENAHKIAFNRSKPAHWDRIDFALLAVNEVDNVPMGYITCREHDHETIYIQFGGAMPGTKGSGKSQIVFDLMLDHLYSLYKRVTFLVENDNFAMLKLAMNAGFKIIGIRNYHGIVLLEHGREV